MADFAVLSDADAKDVVMINLNNVVKIAPHPDDEGTLIYFSEDHCVRVREHFEKILEDLDPTVLLESD